jgi:hypothetical protein
MAMTEEQLAELNRQARDPDQLIVVMPPPNRLQRVVRFEVVDETGRVYVRDPRVGGPIQVELSYQDDGRTLKVFVKPREHKAE